MANVEIPLAVLGGKPAFERMLHVGRPNIGDREKLMQRMTDMLDRHWFTNNGPYVQEFEESLCKLLGVRNCIAMCNATVALEITSRALGMTGEVIMPSFTFIATAHALQWQRITPVFCDIDPATHNISPDRIEEMITPRTTGIIGVHLWGRPCDVESIEAIARRRGLVLLFDAAHALGCSRNGRMVGNFGCAEVFSFHATKFCNAFEGGAVATNDDNLAEKIRLMKNFGFAGFDNVIYIGTNGKMSEVSAAMGITSLESIDDLISINKRNYIRYRENLAAIPGISIIDYNDSQKCNYQYIVLEIDEEQAGIGRDLLVKVLHAENVIARRYFFPGCHRMEPYRSYFPHASLMLPNTERVSSRILLLPTGTGIETTDIDIICRIIRIAIENAVCVRNRFLDDFVEAAWV